MGGGGESRRARRAAEQEERNRIAQVTNATRRINSVYDSPERATQYKDFVTALRDYYTQDATRQKDVADRNLRFSLARSGLTGGSAAVDAGRTLADEFSRGLIESERRAQGSLADLQSQDQASKLNLIQLAQQGADATTAAQQASAAMRANLGAARGGIAQGLGDIFAATTKTYERQREAAAQRRAQMLPVGTLYDPFVAR